jgi:hypothetical protein
MAVQMYFFFAKVGFNLNISIEKVCFIRMAATRRSRRGGSASGEKNQVRER